MSNIYKVMYDIDWGSRGTRRNFVWYTEESMSKKRAIDFVKTQLGYQDINEDAVEFDKLVLNKKYMITLDR